MKKIFALVLTILLLTVCSVSAGAYASPSLNDFSFVGCIVDAYGNALPGVTIELNDGSTVVADSNGYFTFSDLEAGNYVITVTDADKNVATKSFSISEGDLALTNGSDITANNGATFSLVLQLDGDNLALTDVKSGNSNSSAASATSGSSSASSTASTSTTATSPKTGASDTIVVLMAAAALVLGGVAFAAKKKLDA